MSKIFLHIQTLTSVDRDAYASALHLLFHIGRHTDHNLCLFTPNRSSIDRGRNEAAKYAMALECDYLWFLDDDMVVPPNVLSSLLDADKDIVMAHSYIRGYPYKPMCFKWVNSDKEYPELEYFNKDEDLYELKDEKGLCDVASVGFTCTLIKTELLKKLNPPYFVTSPTGLGTEDVYFCLRCKFEIGMETSIAVDTRVPTIHLGEKEYVSASTVEHLRKYQEAINPELLKMIDGRVDRSKEYHEKCLSI